MNIFEMDSQKKYENALAYKLKKQSINCEQQVPLKVYFEDDVVVGEYFADLVVDKKIIIELKTAQSLDKIHYAQVKNYLQATRYKLGLLINFGKTTLEFKRIIV